MEPAAPRATITDLIEWVGDQSDYDISKALNDPPGVSLCDEGTEISYEGDGIIVDAQLRGTYDMKIRHIHLVKPWQASSIKDLSTLLHELVHDVQYLNRSWSCKEAAEWEAYKLQEAWLLEQGVPSGFDWMRIFLLSRCPRDIHP